MLYMSAFCIAKMEVQGYRPIEASYQDTKRRNIKPCIWKFLERARLKASQGLKSIDKFDRGTNDHESRNSRDNGSTTVKQMKSNCIRKVSRERIHHPKGSCSMSNLYVWDKIFHKEKTRNPQKLRNACYNYLNHEQNCHTICDKV